KLSIPPISKPVLLFVCICLAAVACKPSGKLAREEGVSYSPKTISQLATKLDTSSVFSSNFTGFALYDPAADRMIYAQNEHRYFTPASNTKLFTFYAGLKLLPNLMPALRYVSRGDSLIFWGTGDPSFLHPEIGDSKVYSFLRNRKDKLYFSDANFDDKRLGPGWAWDDYQYAYQAEKSALPLYGNMVHFEKDSQSRRENGNKKGTLRLEPAMFEAYIDTIASKRIGRFILRRDISGNRFRYNPEKKRNAFSLNKPYHYTPQLITDMLSDTLAKEVDYADVPLPDTTNVLYSIPTDTAYKHMLGPSDNFIAEQLLLVMADQLGGNLNAEAVIDTMENHYLDFMTDEPQWADGSGLSRYNLFTPASMVQLLAAIDKEFHSDQQLFELLPAGGERGTIEHWYAARDGGPPYIFAKTGTLSNNHNLSGY